MRIGAEMWSEYFAMIDFSRLPSSSSSSPSREVQRHVGAAGSARGGLHREFAAAVAHPAHRVLRWRAGAAGDHGDLVGHDEARIKADAELPDQLRILLLVAAQLCEELARPGLGDRPEVLDRLLPAHPDAVVGDGDRALRLVAAHLDRQLAMAFHQRRLRDRFEPQLVQRIGGIADQLAQEDFLVAVQRVDHQVQQLLDFGLKSQRLLQCRIARTHRCSSSPSDLRRPRLVPRSVILPTIWARRRDFKGANGACR